MSAAHTPAAYFDTSAIVKLYLREAGSEDTAALFERCAQVFSHEMAFVELRAALAAAHRLERIDDAQHRTLADDFGADWRDSFSALRSDEALLDRAADLAEGFALRGHDAVHLAAADRLRLTLPGLHFASFDRNLNRAARLLGLQLTDFVPHA